LNNIQASVSVLIPTSGRTDLLRRALQSLVASELRPDQVLVVVDSSVSNASVVFKLVEEEFRTTLENLSCFQSSGPTGASATRNNGLQRVSSKYVAFLDDDDEFCPEKLGWLVQELEETGAIFGFSDYWRISSAGPEYMRCAPKQKYKGNLARELAFDDCRIATPTVVVNTSAIQALMPLFPDHMAIREDNYAWIKLATTAGFSYVHVDRALVKVNLSEDSIQRPAAKSDEGLFPLFTLEDRKLEFLARSLGLDAPLMHKPRAAALRIFAYARKSFRKRGSAN